MALWKFRCDVAFDTKCDIMHTNRTVLESLAPMAVNDETRNYDDTVAADVKCIESLDQHHSLDLNTGLKTKTFTKIAV